MGVRRRSLKALTISHHNRHPAAAHQRSDHRAPPATARPLHHRLPAVDAAFVSPPPTANSIVRARRDSRDTFVS